VRTLPREDQVRWGSNTIEQGCDGRAGKQVGANPPDPVAGKPTEDRQVFLQSGRPEPWSTTSPSPAAYSAFTGSDATAITPTGRRKGTRRMRPPSRERQTDQPRQALVPIRADAAPTHAGDRADEDPRKFSQAPGTSTRFAPLDRCCCACVPHRCALSRRRRGAHRERRA